MQLGYLEVPSIIIPIFTVPVEVEFFVVYRILPCGKLVGKMCKVDFHITRLVSGDIYVRCSIIVYFNSNLFLISEQKFVNICYAFL